MVPWSFGKATGEESEVWCNFETVIDFALKPNETRLQFVMKIYEMEKGVEASFSQTFEKEIKFFHTLQTWDMLRVMSGTER